MPAWQHLARDLARSLLLVLATLGLFAGLRPVEAQVGSARFASIVVEMGTGKVLEQSNPDDLRRPASLAKLMTLYLAFEALRDRRISLDETLPVSLHAASMQPTKLGLVPGTRITVEQAIMGLVTRSANDAAAALGELLGGTEPRFAQMMTLRARSLGMAHTIFANASGLPDPNAWTTARDLAVLARHLITDFPSYYHYFSTPSFVFRNQVILSHDNMLRWYPGADGLKTGYTEESGHNLVTSAVRDGVRLIGVELGCASNGERDAHMAALLNAGFVGVGVPVEERSPVVMAVVRARLPSLISEARAAEFERRTVIHARASARVHSVAARPRTLRAASVRARHPAGRPEARLERAAARGSERLWRPQVVRLVPGAPARACSASMRHSPHCVVLRSDTRRVAHL
jgi:D-alanyl-D-alanine carboxypeptidase